MVRIISVVILILLLGGITYWNIFHSNKQQPLTEAATSTSVSSPQATSTATTQVVPKHAASSTVEENHPGMKLYRNDEYGFEFWYPEKWELFIEPHGLGYYSKFEMVAAPTSTEYDLNPLFVNVVEPVFARAAFSGPGMASTSIAVDGTTTVKYAYDFEGDRRQDVVLPLGKYSIILGVGSEKYFSDYDKILSTFRLINQ